MKKFHDIFAVSIQNDGQTQTDKISSHGKNYTLERQLIIHVTL